LGVTSACCHQYTDPKITKVWNNSHMGFLDPQYLDAIKGFEGYSATPAWDYKQNSSGYGTVAQAGDNNIPPDQLKAIHEQRFQSEVQKAADHVDNINPDLPAGPRAALISLTYNAGPGWAQSGLGDLVRKGDLQGAAAKLQEYNKAGGEVNSGLVARRAQEASWFGAPLQGAPAASASRLNAIPPAAAPMFAPQPQAQPQQQIAAPPTEQIPPMGAPPIFAPQRRAIDLARLKAAFQQPSFYNRGS
jgi:lysozyme